MKFYANRLLLLLVGITLLISVISISGCGSNSKQTNAEATKEKTIVFGSYSVNKEPFEKLIIPAFQKYWKDKTGENVKFQTSYIASGAQARAIIGGFEADVAALSLEGDIQQIVKAGLITNDWKGNKYNGMVTNSVVVVAVKPGNPKGIKDWEDLAKPGIGVLYPNPKTSGGAMWDVNAIYGAGLKATEASTGKADEQYARELLKRVQKNVKVMDKSGRESFTTFQKGNGDAVVTYESEALRAIADGEKYDLVYPKSTILIQNPVAMVDKNIQKHGNKEVVEAFVNFLFSKESQENFAKSGFRPVDPEAFEQQTQKFPNPELLFNIDYLGGWEKVQKDIYSSNGLWSQVVEELAKG
jgi:sulfate/thiosulfate transport system substrate-binding protein